MATWTNKDGLPVNFGTDRARLAKSGHSAVSAGGDIKTMVVKYTAGDPPSATDIQHGGQAFIPAGASITRAVLSVDTAFAGGTSFDIGTYQSNGTTVIDADGIDAGVLLAAVNSTSDVVQCDGAQVGGAVGMTADAYIIIAETGTFTAGEATITIEYVL